MSAKKGTKLGIWMATYRGRQVMGYFFGFGAALVIVGALFKIQHLPGCDIMLNVGLGTEAFLFSLMSFQISHPDPDWSVYYPYILSKEERPSEVEEIDGTRRNLLTNPLDIGGSGSDGPDAAEKVAQMLEKASIDQPLLERLGVAMRDLSANAEQLKGMSNAASATNNYVASLNEAAEKVSTLVGVYEKAADSVAGLAASSGGPSIGSQMDKVANNLEALNNVYELQLQGSTAHLEATKDFQKNVTDMMENLSASVNDTKLYRENMAALAENLSNLNNVYGNMLKAMKS